MPTSVRLDEETGALLRRLAKTKGKSQSEILREAIRHLAHQHQTESGPSALVLVKDLVGVASGGPTGLARTHKQAFKEALVYSKKAPKSGR